MKRTLAAALLIVSGSSVQAAPPLYVPEVEEQTIVQRQPAIQPIPETIPEHSSSRIIQTEAVQPQLQPIPAQPPAALPQTFAAPPAAYPLASYSAVPVRPALYPHVRVKDARRAHPLGVKTVIQAPNPCRGQCAPVMVEVCLPPCEPLAVDVGPRGQRITYHYGTHRVEVTSLRGVVTVDYDN